jgi:excinuclease ABC subunit C
MQEAAEKMDYELAAQFKFKIQELSKFNIKSEVANINVKNVDVFTIKKSNDIALINYLNIIDGNIVNSHNQIIHLQADETEIEILQTVIPHLQILFESKNKEIILPFALEFNFANYIITIPKAGDKKKLLDFSTKNSLYQLGEALRNKYKKSNDNDDKDELLLNVQADLQLADVPTHIECFDNSNLQGTNAVSAMVCFKNGQPSKKDYRHYNVKTVEGINDFASMKEVVYRRYKRLLDEKTSLPQLVIIDGGKGQLSAAYESIIELGLQGKITLIGLAKNIEELFFVGDTESIKFPYNSKTLLLLRRIRDEVHNLGITHHRNKRSANTFTSQLNNLEGIGKNTIALLLKNFKSVKKIKETSFEELVKIIGKSKAKIIVENKSML